MIKTLKFERKVACDINDAFLIENAYEVAEKTGCKVLSFKSIGAYGIKITIFSNEENFIDFVRFFIKNCGEYIQRVSY